MTGFRAAALAAGLMIAALVQPVAADAGRLETLKCPTESIRLVVMGDSLADGLWGSVFRAFAHCSNVRVVRLTSVSDGLAKSAPEIWLDRYVQEISQSEAIDIVVVQVGANDLTAIRDGTTRATYKSDDWNAKYQARAAELAKALAERAATLIWLGLPVVGRSDLEGAYREISAMQAAAVTGNGGSFVDIHAYTQFGADGFVMNAEIDGETEVLRASDQVHFTEIGYDYVAGLLQDDLEKYFSFKSRSAAVIGAELQ